MHNCFIPVVFPGDTVTHYSPKQGEKIITCIGLVIQIFSGAVIKFWLGRKSFVIIVGKKQPKL